jgi:hypothetical protein
MTFPVEHDGDLARHLVHALEDEAAHPLEEAEANAPEGCHYFSELEVSLAEWSFAYGLAWALIRAREPFVSSRGVAQQARLVTAEAWSRVGGESWTKLMADDRATRGPVEGDDRPPQLGEFMGRLAQTRPRRRPRDRRGKPD